MVQGRLEASDFAPNNEISDMSRIADRRMPESRNDFIIPLFYNGAAHAVSSQNQILVELQRGLAIAGRRMRAESQKLLYVRPS
jgi:hypothetical protein